MTAKIKDPSEFDNARQAERIIEDRAKHEKDILQPWNYDNKPNAEFVKAYPDKAQDFFTREELEAL